MIDILLACLFNKKFFASCLSSLQTQLYISDLLICCITLILFFSLFIMSICYAHARFVDRTKAWSWKQVHFSNRIPLLFFIFFFVVLRIIWKWTNIEGLICYICVWHIYLEKEGDMSCVGISLNILFIHSHEYYKFVWIRKTCKVSDMIFITSFYGIVKLILQVFKGRLSNPYLKFFKENYQILSSYVTSFCGTYKNIDMVGWPLQLCDFYDIRKLLFILES